ncbi:MAG: hypothetical protein KAW49_14910, partial [Anaerolineae bacterium]|nr:hypothetical protein [Anaerolineae bacterium]
MQVEDSIFDIVSNYVLEQSLTSWDWTKMLSSVRLDIPIPFKLKESNNDKCKRNKAKAPESYSYVAPRKHVGRVSRNDLDGRRYANPDSAS